MRLTLRLLFLALLLYLGGASIVSARTGPVRHAWSGHGNAPTIHFSMPTGPLPGVASRPWLFRYAISCHGLKPTPGAPANTYMESTFSFSLTGSHPFGGGAGMIDGDNRGHATQSTRFGDGGSYALSIRARPTCAWRVTAATA